ncbi:MAG: hypothetical protein GWO23_12380, partial [Gammaproteobacteria bacterium]|nr:hypothetical protein [Gammaproteobacteria bacterium]
MKKQIILWLSCLTLFLFILSLPAYAGKGGGNKGGGSYGKADKQMMKEKHQYKKQEQYEYEQDYQQK